MGVVDLARNGSGELVALKRLGLYGTPSEMQVARARFERELETLRRVRHDAIVPLLEVLDDDGDLVLVMPYLEGGSLADVVSDRGPLPSTEVEAIAGRLLPALAAAHRQGVVHRDIKPANVLFDADGRAHLADFGVATSIDATDGLTRTGVVLGTPGFLAPEQARGEPATAASDIASLGATLHFAATGRSPYGGGEAPAVLLRTARARGTIDRDLEPRLRRMITAMLDRRPHRRPTAAALAGGVSDTDPIPLLGRRKRTAIVVGCAALALVAVAVGVTRAGEPGDADAAPTTEATEPCQPLPYRPCGGTDAPHTDGRGCIDDHADYDGVAGNGCEAAPDAVDGTVLADRIEGNIVPADDTDRYPLVVRDESDIGCNNTLRLQLTAPTSVTLRLQLVDDEGEVLGETTSADGTPGEVAVRDPRCFRDDGGGFEAIVTPTGSDRTADAYVLTRRGSF